MMYAMHGGYTPFSDTPNVFFVFFFSLLRSCPWAWGNLQVDKPNNAIRASSQLDN